MNYFFFLSTSANLKKYQVICFTTSSVSLDFSHFLMVKHNVLLRRVPSAKPVPAAPCTARGCPWSLRARNTNLLARGRVTGARYAPQVRGDPPCLGQGLLKPHWQLVPT